MTATVTPTCVSWLVLATYAVLLGVGGLGVWVSFNNFGNDEPVAPAPPPLPESNTTTTTTTAAPYKYSYYDRTEKVPQAYKDYAEKSRVFARASDDARFFLGPPCMVCGMVAAIVLVAGLCSRQLFSSTFSLYSSLGMWIATLLCTIAYQNSITPQSNGPFNLDSAGWILGIHVSLLLLLSVQILLCMWELRRQKAGVWPTINFLNVFTLEAALLAARLTLLVFTFASLTESQMITGLLEEDNPYNYDYNRPRVRYPLTVTILCCSAALYSAVATLETTLSMLLGKLHGCMTSLTCLLSALYSVTIAVLSSPVFGMIFVGPYSIYPATMNFAICLSLVTFLHVSASLFIPTISRSPPSILSHVIDNLSEIYNLGSTMHISEQRVRTLALTLKKRSRMLYINLASAVFSIISIILIATTFRGPEVWGRVMVMCVNFAVVVRTVPPVVMELAYEWRENVNVKQKLMTLGLESIVLLVSAIAVCFQSWIGQAIFAGVMNIFFSAFQGTIMWVMIKRKLLEASQPEETQHLVEAEEVTSQCSDDQKNSIDAVA